jgi:hypothetical protein
MTRIEFIERLRRQVYGDFPADDSTITDNLVNKWIVDGTAIAAKKNYTDNFQLDGVAYVNNGFYSTFKGLSIAQDQQFLYKFTLPEIPLGIGSVDGISRVVFKDENNNISYPGVLLSENQVAIQRSMRQIPNKLICYPEGGYCYIISTLIMNVYTATVTMVSGGDAGNLNSVLNIPGDYIETIVKYIQGQLMIQRNMPVDAANDGLDAIKTT